MSIYKLALFISFFIFSWSAWSAPGMAKKSASCAEDQESKFFRLMTDKFLKYVFQTDVKGLPYNVRQAIDLINSTCITSSNERISIDDNFKDAINYYPEHKSIVLYRPAWEQFRTKFTSGQWTMDNYYQMFRIIHHELVPAFIKKGDPNFETSLALYNYTMPYASPESYHGTWLYVQKNPSPNFGFYMGQNCAISVSLNSHTERPRTPEEIENDHTRASQKHSFRIYVGLQNPNSNIECPTSFDADNISSSKINDISTTSFFIYCETEPIQIDFRNKMKLPEDFGIFGDYGPIGEFRKYRRFTCQTRDMTSQVDRHLMAVVTAQMDLLPNREIKITFNFYRTTLEKPIFSFSNVYTPIHQIHRSEGGSMRSEKSDQKSSALANQLQSYPIQKWIYANKYPTSEENCAVAKHYIDDYVNKSCDEWVYYFDLIITSNRPDLLYTRELYTRDIIFAGPNDGKRLYCEPGAVRTYEIKTPADHGCIVVGEKMVMKKEKY